MALSQSLLDRLEAIGIALASTDHALALIGLGSVGIDRDRLDAYSDLDFFVIARNGWKSWFLNNLTWLSTIAPIAYHFRNTEDGYKLLYQDGIFCEFAVFEHTELTTIPFSPGRVVWHAPDFDASVASPQHRSPAHPPSVAWSVGEALTNLYIGLGRYYRGEKLSAFRFIQHYAVDRILELTEQIEAAQPGKHDQFAHERRYEQRFPNTSRVVANFMQGYDRSRESARAMLDFLEAHFEVNPAIAHAIRALCSG
jgi:lincosamide nucleotidyltransferase B/F